METAWRLSSQGTHVRNHIGPLSRENIYSLDSIFKGDFKNPRVASNKSFKKKKNCGV